jgi:hypothetical protein
LRTEEKKICFVHWLLHTILFFDFEDFIALALLMSGTNPKGHH